MPPEAIFLLEREVKLFFSTAAAAREAVLALGAAFSLLAVTRNRRARLIA